MNISEKFDTLYGNQSLCCCPSICLFLILFSIINCSFLVSTVLFLCPFYEFDFLKKRRKKKCPVYYRISNILSVSLCILFSVHTFVTGFIYTSLKKILAVAILPYNVCNTTIILRRSCTF